MLLLLLLTMMVVVHFGGIYDEENGESSSVQCPSTTTLTHFAGSVLKGASQHTIIRSILGVQLSVVERHTRRATTRCRLGVKILPRKACLGSMRGAEMEWRGVEFQCPNAVVSYLGSSSSDKLTSARLRYGRCALKPCAPVRSGR